MSGQDVGRSAEIARDELISVLKETPHTEAEKEVARRWFAGEATPEDLGDAMRARLLRALNKRAIPPATPESLECNAMGMGPGREHDAHDWDFGSGETFRCPGDPSLSPGSPSSGGTS